MKTQIPAILTVALAIQLIPGAVNIAAAQEEEAPTALDYQPPVYSEVTIPLLEAVRVTLEHQPNIRLQRENELLRSGIAQQATGQFDMSFVGDLEIDHTEQESSSTDDRTLVQETNTGSLDLGLSKQLRSGPVLTPFVQLSGTNLSYSGDSVDATVETIDLYTSAIGFQIDIPLGRGRGVQSTGASEKAAEIDYRASIITTAHTASSEVLQTVQAYWTMLAAQRSLAVLERSLELNKRLLDLTQAMVDADEMPRAEMARARAREAESMARVEEARRNLYQARLDFVTTVGFQAADQSQAPMASDEFPVPADDAELEAIDAGLLTDSAFDLRQDYKAAQLSEESGLVLYRAATVDLSPQTDLGLDVSYTGREASTSVGDGLEGILFGDWTGPSAGADISVDLPFGNNTQRGQRDQQRALYNQSIISTRDLARRIQSNVVLISESLKEAALQTRRYREAVDFYRDAVKSEVEKFRIGMSTLLDTNFTEQNQILAELSMIASQRDYAQLLARLRFETATLVVEGPDGWTVNRENLFDVPTAGE
jgi:outer membrane protein TolC